jgi:hypothetical protein
VLTFEAQPLPNALGAETRIFNAVHQLRILGRWMRMITIPNWSSVEKAFLEFDEAGRMKPSAVYERVVDVMEELMKFTLLTRDLALYLVDRYTDVLVPTLNSRKRKYDERVAAEPVRTQVGEALRRRANLGFVDMVDGVRVRPRPALMRFAISLQRNIVALDATASSARPRAPRRCARESTECNRTVAPFAS